MKALTWHGKRDVRVDTHSDPAIVDPTDVIVRITSTAICGSDLHLYEIMGPFLDEGDILGHEPMGVVEEVGPEVTAVAPGDRVVVPFNVSCGTCFMCGQGLQSQCETTQVREENKGASLFGYTKLYGQVPGGQAELLRVPFGNTLPIKVPEGPPDERFLFLSDVLPTSWQAVEYAAIPDGGSVVVLGLGPIGDMSSRVAQHRGARVIGVDLVPERLERVRARGDRGPRPRRARRRPRRRRPRHDRRPRAGRRHRRGRDGGARGSRRQGGPDGGRPAPGRDGRGDHEARGRRPARGAAPRDRARPARRHDLPQRRLRRR